MNIYFLHGQNLPFLRYIHCNFCLNLFITHGDMEENVSGCFLLNTVYKETNTNKRQTHLIRYGFKIREGSPEFCGSFNENRLLSVDRVYYLFGRLVARPFSIACLL